MLEVAAGTGRLAIPLAELGLDVTATDNPRRYGLVLNAWNSIWMLVTAEQQQAAVTAAADRLLPGGLLAVEVNVLREDRPAGECSSARDRRRADR